MHVTLITSRRISVIWLRLVIPRLRNPMLIHQSQLFRLALLPTPTVHWFQPQLESPRPHEPKAIPSLAQHPHYSLHPMLFGCKYQKSRRNEWLPKIITSSWRRPSVACKTNQFKLNLRFFLRESHCNQSLQISHFRM